MRIGLLISEFHDRDVCDLCLGADRAAKDLGVELIIFPGKYIITDKNQNNYDPFMYQHQAVYDYCIDAGFDGLIVDIEKIGKDAPILKREAFLNQFGKKPLLTVTETEGYDFVIAEKNTTNVELGYLCIEQMIDIISGNKVKAKREEIDNYTIEDYEKALNKISILSDALIYSPDIESCVESISKSGIANLETFILEEPVECSLKKGWKIPKHCKKIISIHDGKPDKDGNNVDMDISMLFNFTKISGTKVIRNFFDETSQLGVIITDFNKDYRCARFDDIITNLIQSWNMNHFLGIILQNVEKELDECQEELAREGSVLDHIGENDYLTNLPNRRGFFAKAYDLLKEEFRENTYAVVAYIDMDSLKNINAIHGHDEGDNAVRRVAEILQDVFKEKSVCGRIRGDEFAVLQVTDEEDKAEALRIEMARQNNRLLMDNTKYLNHLIYSICEFDYEDSLSLREMLKETDDNLKNMRRMEMIGG